ncbi:MAG: hypothetical protein Q6362_007350 [Candidatus Wukongarchaeota archaeon]|nr:hypothetical protein [Candidatus Wukongarchaeota archaeon]MDO8129234.1 hypothetical protein [Candidatus Wukongarchaeota archaeon]
MDKHPDEMIKEALKYYGDIEEKEQKPPSEKTVNICICGFFAFLILAALFLVYFFLAFF